VTNFPTAPEPVPEWPAGCASDAAVVARIKAKAADQLKRTNLIRDPKARRAAEDALFDSKIALLVELAAFEASRSTVKLGSGESTDAERMRYKITQAAYASRFMNEKGRRLRIEDETINVGWDDSVAAAIAEDKAARK
jgi:hypothetical protein